jgi:hypothetical protein
MKGQDVAWDASYEAAGVGDRGAGGPPLAVARAEVRSRVRIEGANPGGESRPRKTPPRGSYTTTPGGAAPG